MLCRHCPERIGNSLSTHLSAGEGIGFTIKEKANPAKASGTGNLSGALIDCEMPEDDTKRSCANSDCVHFDGSPICPGCDRVDGKCAVCGTNYMTTPTLEELK